LKVKQLRQFAENNCTYSAAKEIKENQRDTESMKNHRDKITQEASCFKAHPEPSRWEILSRAGIERV
jgi:hypothetical protein